MKYNFLQNDIYKSFFDNEEFKTAWEEYKEWKKAEKKGAFNSEIGERRALIGLHKLSKGDYRSAIEHLEYAMCANWRGLFPIPQNQKQVNGWGNEN
jgi:hypothetical protein